MVRAIINILLTLYIVFSFILLIDLDWILSYFNNEIATFVNEHSDEVYSIRYINFTVMFIISLLTFYVQGYEDGKKDLSTPTKEAD